MPLTSLSPLSAVRGAVPTPSIDREALRQRVQEAGGSAQALVSVAAPIHDRQGRCIAAINISGFAYNDTEEGFRDRFLPHLLDAATRLSGMLV